MRNLCYMPSLLLEKSALCDIIITIGGQNYVIFNQNRRTSRRDRARAVAKGTGVLLDFLDNASVKLRPLSHIPLIGDTIGDVRTLYQCCTITITANIKRFRRS